MKSILIVLTLCAKIYCQGQDFSEREEGTEIEEIILNYRKNKIDHFEIRINSIYVGKIDNKCEKHYYLILDDSILVEKYKRRGTRGYRYAIRNNEFYYLPDKPLVEKKVTYYDSEGPFLYGINYDSANVHNVKFYSRNFQDSILIYEIKITKDSLGRVIEDILRNYSGPAAKNSTNSFKRVWRSDHNYKYSYANDTFCVETSELKGNVWVPKYWGSYVTKINSTQTDTLDEKITTIISKDSTYGCGPTCIHELTYRVVRKIIYDDNHLIQSITYGPQYLDNGKKWYFDEAWIVTARKSKK